MKVTTFSKNRVEKSNCRKIGGVYYEKNVDCFYMSDEKWHRINNGLIDSVTDDLVNYKLLLKHEINSSYKRVITGIDKDANLVLENVHLNFLKIDISKYGITPRMYVSGDHRQVASFKILRRLSAYSASNGFYIHFRDMLSNEDINNRILKLSKITNFKELYKKLEQYGVSDQFLLTGSNSYNREELGTCKVLKRGLCYSLDNYSINSKTEIEPSYSQIKEKLNDYDFKMAKMLNGSTFGLEIESSFGKIPLDILMENCFYPLRDGSISGTEYTSSILSDSSGLYKVKEITKWFREALGSSNQESFHVHIKSNPVSKRFVVHTFNNLRLVEDEIFSLFPSFIKKTSLFKVSGKDYNNPLPNIKVTDDIDGSFKRIYRYYLTDNYDFDDIFNGFGDSTTRHPMDESHDRKWNIRTRYHNINMIPTLFNKSGTVEFRLHPPTFDYTKIMYWVLIVNAIVKFSNQQRPLAKSLSLRTIIYSVYSDEYSAEIVEDLISYINSRKGFYSRVSSGYSNDVADFILKGSVTRDSITSLRRTLKNKIWDIESGKHEINNDSIDAFK